MPQTSAKKSPQLSREDWVEAAITLLVEGGIDTVQITQLARRLCVSRGSFYWHFENREDLLDALVDVWIARNTGVMVKALADAATLDDGLLNLFAVWVDRTLFDPEMDQAIRDWARHTPALFERLKSEDATRVSTIAEFLGAHGFEHPEAFIRARVIYFTQLSFYAQEVQEPMDIRLSYLDAYFRCFIGRPADRSAATRFKDLMGDTP